MRHPGTAMVSLRLRAMIRALRVVLQLLAGYLLAMALAWTFQRQLVYPGTWRSEGAPPPGTHLATYPAADGVTAHALELDVPGADRTVVYFHGNGEVAGDDVWVARELAREGFATVLVEYRGYGSSRPGTPSEPGLYADAEAVLRGLAARGVDARHVVLWGASLGTGVAAEMAARGLGSALVLVTPYTSLVDVAAVRVPFLPVGLLMRDRFDTLGKAPTLALPTMVLHGTADEVVPYAMGERVAGAIPGARFVSVEGGRHMNLFLGAGVRYFHEVAAFVRGHPVR